MHSAWRGSTISNGDCVNFQYETIQNVIAFKRFLMTLTFYLNFCLNLSAQRTCLNKIESYVTVTIGQPQQYYLASIKYDQSG